MSYFDRKTKLLDNLKSLKELAQEKLNENVDDLDFFEKELEDLNFNVLCLGDFSSGKSTFINNFFLEDKVKLPVRVTTTTAKLTIVKYGEELKVLAVMKDGSRKEIKENIEESLKSMVASKGSQLEHIEFVEVQIPSEILKEGIVIVDSPGLNDPVTERMNVTFDFVNQSDCILYFLYARQAWKNSEKEFLEDKILSKNDLDKIFFLMNHWDTIEEEERDELFSDVNNKIAKSIKTTKEKLQNNFINEPPLIPISAKTGENFDELREKIFAYLGNKKAQDILEQKIKKYNNYIALYLGLIDQKAILFNKDKEQIKLKQKQQELELKGYQLKIKEKEKYIVREVANKYDKFVDDLQYEFKQIIIKFNIEIKNNIEKIEKKEDFEKYYKRALKTAESSSIDPINKVKEKFKRNIKEIFYKEKSDLNISFNKVIDDEYLDAKILNTSAYLNNRDELTEQLSAGLGVLATLTSGAIGTALLISSTTAGTAGFFSSIGSGIVTFFVGTAGMSGIAVSGLIAAPLAVVGIAGYFLLKENSKQKFRQDVENAIEDITNNLQDNYNNKAREMQQAEDTVSEIIAENITNEFVEQYQLKLDGYKEISVMQNSEFDVKNDLNGVKDEISALRIEN
jgi:predicted GTPase